MNHFKNGDSLEQPIGLDILDSNIEIVVSSELEWVSFKNNLLEFLIPAANACVLAPPYGNSTIINFQVAKVDAEGNVTDVSQYFNLVEASNYSRSDLALDIPNYVLTNPPVSSSYTLRANESINITGQNSFKVLIFTSSDRALESSIGPFNVFSHSTSGISN